MSLATSLDPAIELLLRLFLASILIQAATHKLRASDRFRADLAGYDLLPESGLAAFAWLIPGVEIAIALGLVFGLLFGPLLGSHAAAAGAAAILLALYSGAIAINLQRGRRDIACGCGGPADRRSIGAEILLRNALLILLALACTLPVGSRALTGVDVPTLLGGWLAAIFLYAASESALANRDRQRLWSEIS